MRHKKLTFLLLLLLITVLSCRKHKDGAPKYYLVKEEIINSPTVSYTYTYAYDTDNRLKTITWSGAPLSESFVMTVDAFDEKGRIAVITQNYTSTTDIKISYMYDGEGRLSKIEYYTISGTGSLTHFQDKVFTYTPAKITYTLVTFPGGATYSSTEYFINETGNITQARYYNSTGTLTGSIDYSSFDDKRHYATGLPAEYYALPISTNNPVVITNRNATGATIGIVTYIYEYNQDGLPLSSTPSSPAAQAKKYTYETR